MDLTTVVKGRNVHPPRIRKSKSHNPAPPAISFPSPQTSNHDNSMRFFVYLGFRRCWGFGVLWFWGDKKQPPPFAPAGSPVCRPPSYARRQADRLELTTERGNWGVWKRRWVWDFLKGFPKSSQKELGEGGWGRRLGEVGATMAETNWIPKKDVPNPEAPIRVISGLQTTRF